MRSGTINNKIRWSKNWGGTRKCFETKPTLLPGGFNFDLKELPVSGNVLPAGSPVSPLYLFEVKSVDNDAKTVTVVKSLEGTRAKVGMSLIILGNDLSVAADSAMKVTAIDSTADNVDVLTVDALASGIKATDVIAEATSEKKVKVVPNALTPYDTCVDEDSFACDGDAAWAVYDTPVLERRGHQDCAQGGWLFLPFL